MQSLAMWNPFAIVGHEIASKKHIEETVRELFNSKPHAMSTLGVAMAALSAAWSGAFWTAMAATLIVVACLMVRIALERCYKARNPNDPQRKWISLFVYGSWMSGLGTGLSCAMLLYGSSTGTQAITMAVACAIAQAAAGRAYTMPGTALIHIALILGQMSIVVYANGDYMYLPAFLLYLVFLASFTRHMVRTRLRQLRAEQVVEKLLLEITEKNELLRIANETLAAQAYRDPLTRLANRRKFDLVFAERLVAAAQDGSPISLMLIDVDHFKAFNDTYGHQSGDECLQHLTRAISNAVSSEGSLVARYGGEEFVVILPGQTLEEARIIAENTRIAVRLTSLDTLPNAPPHQTISIGLVACNPGSPATREAMLAAADAALYEAKKQGRNRVCVYSGTADMQQIPSSFDTSHQS